ncbi:MAG TPA: serine/threonine-protein kinase, partial [Gemmataceae bacterium]|nr:serine/threonine-protein kinase [Gemmataceae bacterium]
MTQPESPGTDSLAGSAAPDVSPTHEVSTEGTDPGARDGPPAVADFAFLSPPLGPGELGRLGGYRVLELLGAGGMGLVFRAEDPTLRRPVALKVMRPELLDRPHAAERFLREARAAAAVKHDHIVTIYQVGQDRGVPFLALEFLAGEPLDARAKRESRLPPAEVRRIGHEAALGLAAAHAAGLIHRDIKPANVWLEAPRGRVKILDFGLARATGQDVHLTGSGTVMGTPAYMSPEQANGQPVDARTDLFSLGAMLYRLATGRLPFPGDSAMAILAA